LHLTAYIILCTIGIAKAVQVHPGVRILSNVGPFCGPVGVEIAAHNAGVGPPTVCPIGSASGSDAESYDTSHC